MIKRAAIVLAAVTLSFGLTLAPKAFADDMKKELDVKGKLDVQGFDEEGLDVEGFNVQGRDVKGKLDVEGRHEKGRNEEVRAFPCGLALKRARSL